MSELTNFRVIHKKEDKDFLEINTGQKWRHLLVNTSEEFKNITNIVSNLLYFRHLSINWNSFKIDNVFSIASGGYPFSAILKFRLSFVRFKVTWMIEMSKDGGKIFKKFKPSFGKCINDEKLNRWERNGNSLSITF